MEMQSVVMLELLLVLMSFVPARMLAADKKEKKKLTRYFVIGGGVGLVVGVIFHPAENRLSVAVYILLYMLVTGVIELFYMVSKRVWYENKPIVYYDDGTPRRFYITGDKHRDFTRVSEFCRDMKTRRKDVLIVLGDAGFNYYEDARDDALKAKICGLNITLFCLHGNKEKRPQNISTYGVRSFCGGRVYYEPKYPNIYFAIDGETYTFEGRKYIVAGGANSVDKQKCMQKGLPYFKDEMPSDAVKATVETTLAEENNHIYGVMTHTCPLKYLPEEMFMSTRQQATVNRKLGRMVKKEQFVPDVDRSTETWLDDLENKLDYSVWFCGHYHIDKQIDKLYMMCHEIRPLHLFLNGDAE